MKWTILSRLMTGYLALLVLAAGVSVYAIVKLRNVQDVAESIIEVDNQLLDLQYRLTDTLLSEQRYEKKFVIMRDETLYREFLDTQAQFDRHMHEAEGLAPAPALMTVLQSIDSQHRVYQRLFLEEAELIRSGRQYSAAWYRGQKEKALNKLGDELLQLRSRSQAGIFDKIGRLSQAGSRATRAAMATAAAGILAGVLLSMCITAGITRPLREMARTMAEYSSGNREVKLAIESPPEIAALCRSFTVMCGRLNELDRLKTDFYALMSHELRTPLSSIREGTNLFLEGRGGPVTDRQKRLLSILAEESNRLIELVNSLLDFSKLEAGMAAYHFSRSDLNPLIVKVVDELTPLAEAKQIRLEKNLNAVPVLRLDSERILQVLRNLLGNALKFTPRGGTVSVSSTEAAKGVRVAITDTGPGIRREHAACIFEKYRQAGDGDAGNQPGSGLGLAIVKHIVQDHGGTVWVDSDGTRGSTFSFVLPPSSS